MLFRSDLSRPVSTELSKYYWKHVEDDLHLSPLFSPLYKLEGSSLHIRSDGYTLAFFWFSAPPPVTLRTKLNTTLLSLNEVGQHSVDIYLKSCRYDAKKEDMRIGMKENKAS